MFADPGSMEPTGDELSAIEAEWPLIAAELDVLDAEIRLICAEDRGGPSLLDWRRCRRAEQRVLRVAAELSVRPGTVTVTGWAA